MGWMEIGGDIAGSLLGNIFANDRQEDAQAFNAEQAAISRAFSKEMMQNKYQWQVKDLEAAGLNPMLAYGQVPSMGSSSAASSGMAGNPNITPPSVSMANAAQIKVADETAKKVAAEVDKTKAEADEIRARTPTYAVSMDQMRQNISESTQRIEELISRVKLQGHTAENIQQNTVNQQATVKQIEATVDQLRTLANLNIAQTAQAQAQTGLTHAQTGLTHAQTGLAKAHVGVAASEIGRNIAITQDMQNKIRANLPQLEAALAELTRQAKILEMPSRHQTAGVSEGYIGALGATLRAINPFADFMHAAPRASYRGQ